MELFHGLSALTWQQVVMVGVGLLLIYLATVKEYEPSLLLPMGFGTLLVNIPLSSALTHVVGNGVEVGAISRLFEMGIQTELFPLLVFIAVGAMIDFTPLFQTPVTMIFGLMAQAGIFLTMGLAHATGFFDLREAASIGIIGAADGPTSIYVANRFAPQLLGSISVAAYSYMALVPIIQPLAIRLVTTKKERRIRMAYTPGSVTRRTRILFPIFVTFIVGLIAPASVALVGFLMFGNLVRECGVLNTLSRTAQDEFSNLITLLLGITISFSMKAEAFVRTDTLLILLIGLAAFVFDTIGGVVFAKVLNLFLKEKVNPMIGAAGISAFPMSSRVVQRMAAEEEKGNILLMHAVGANVSGQIASVVAGGLVISLVTQYL